MPLSLTEWQERLLDGLEGAETIRAVVRTIAEALEATQSVADVGRAVLTKPGSSPPEGVPPIAAEAIKNGQHVDLRPDAFAILVATEGKTFAVIWGRPVGDANLIGPVLPVLARSATMTASRVLERRRQRAMAVEMAALHQVMEGVAAATTATEVAQTALVVCATAFGWDAGAVLCPDEGAADPTSPVPGQRVLAAHDLDEEMSRTLAAVADGGQGLRGGFVGEHLPGVVSGALVWPLHAPTATKMVLLCTKETGGRANVAATLAPIAQMASVARAGLDRVDRIARERAAVEAERASRAKSEFLSRMSHELRTPLNAVLGFAQLLELDDLGQDSMESLAQIKRAGAHLLDLVNEVLDISRIEVGRMSLSLEPLDLAELVTESVSLLRPMAEQRPVELVIEEEALAGTWLRGDRQRVKQILLNLVSNAVKYNRRGGTVTVTADRTAPGTVAITVRDTGVGIQPGDLARLFTPFERLGAEGGAVEGTGLGLALSRGLAELMGGSLDAASVIGEGTEFVLTLPEDEPSQTGEVADAPAARPAATTGASSGTVLYIEDNVPNIKLVERIIRRRPFVGLVHAVTGRDGLALARVEPPDLVLLDLDLPDMHGTDVLRELRSDALTRAVPVVVVSADANARQARALLDAGARDYLAKPFDMVRLL